MIALSPPPSVSASPAQVGEMALHLALTEAALRVLTLGQADAVLDTEGNAYLLRPAQERLRANEQRMQAMLASMADAILVVDRGGIILSEDGAVLRVLGFAPMDLVGRQFFEFIHDEDLPAVHSAFFNVAESLHPHTAVRFRHRSPDGFHRLVEAAISKLQETPAFSAILSLRPVGEAPAPVIAAPAPTALSLGNDRALAMLAHELRTPLTPVLMGLTELEQDERFTEAQPTLAMMRRCLQVETRLLEELFDFTTLGQHKMHLRLEEIDAHDAIHLVLEMCHPELLAAQIAVDLDLQATETIITADSVRLQQVLWNLLKNAIKFSPIGGRILIASAHLRHGKLAISISDRGIGIAPDLLALIFEPFQQGDLEQQRRLGGLGLGLFIAKGLAEAQQGTLTAASVPGHGTTFQLTLSNAR